VAVLVEGNGRNTEDQAANEINFHFLSIINSLSTSISIREFRDSISDGFLMLCLIKT
jgi:hypothetical protein